MKSLLALLLACGLAASITQAADPAPPEYNRDVRPILSEYCFACHGPDSAARKADLRLDQREAAIGMGAIDPGKPDSSELLRRVHSEDADERMPPPATKKRLSAAQKNTLQRWIAAGAEYQPHWSFLPQQKSEPPKVKDEAWIRSPLDRFVLSKLESAGLKPAPEADRRTLARRVSLDLTGLPPDPRDVEAFVSDTAPDAYEKLVDKFLASRHWGEHRGRYWLDAARYADTHGIHFDNFREMWAYRDWVIGAFNRNVPFDRFTIEQLAGDLLPDRTLEQQVASGFNRCNITTNEGGIIDEEYLVLYTRDRTETTSAVWMGLTAGCAVCHDHKFDPLSQREFYEMAAFFNNTTQAAKDGNIKDTPPILFVPRPEDRPQWDDVQRQMAALKQGIEGRKQAARPEFDSWLAQATVEQVASQIPSDGLRLHVPLNEGKGKTVSAIVDGDARELTAETGLAWQDGKRGNKVFSIKAGDTLEIPEAGDFEGDQAFTFSSWVRIPRRNLTGAILARMDNKQGYRGWDIWVEGDRIGTHIVNTWSTDALKVVAKPQLKIDQWYYVSVVYDGSRKASGVKIFFDGLPQAVDVANDNLQSTIRTTAPLKIGQRDSGERLAALLLENLRLYDRALSPAEVEHLARADRLIELLGKNADARNDAERNELFDGWLARFDEPSQKLKADLAARLQDEARLRASGTIAHVMQERGAVAMAHILHRGEYDKRRDEVKARTPAMLPPLPEGLPHNRLGFAQWLLRPEHPLTARVTVNRFWQELFGTGLVRTSGDFGVSGELPSHPELLDWLAIHFRESGWDIKQFFKLIVLSNTYRQSAVVTPVKLENDPQNRLLSRGPRFRMDAEMVRDYALSSSGLLVGKLGGPSVKPYQPPGVWEAVAMIGSNTRDYKADQGDNLYRRSLYTFWKRAAPPALMDIFNAPNRETCAVRRERTNTPLQALATLNDPTFVEAARRLAENALLHGGDAGSSRIDYLAQRLLARSFRDDELPVVQASLKHLSDYYEAHAEDARKLISVGESKADASLNPSTLAAWTMLANELMNLDEVLSK